MKSAVLTDIITQLSTYNYLQVSEILPASSTSKNKADKHLFMCAEDKSIAQRLQYFVDMYNTLLQKITKMINLNYELYEEQQNEYEEYVAEIQSKLAEADTKIKELSQLIVEKNNTIREVTWTLAQKQDDIFALEAENDRKQVDTQVIRENQQLRMHRRQKSHLNSVLQKQKLALFIENERLMQENSKLQRTIRDLNKRYEILQTNLEMTANFALENLDLNIENFGQRLNVSAVSKLGLDENSDKNQEEQDRRVSVSESLDTQVQGNALRDILNMSGQTSEYFHFRTKEKNGNSSKHVINLCSESFENFKGSNENDPHSANMLAPLVKYRKRDVGEIKQFQVHECAALEQNINIVENTGSRLKTQAKAQQPKKDSSIEVPPMDPYYAYFCLTIQCLKLNWGNLDAVANISLTEEYDRFIKIGVPINKWSDQLQSLLHQRVSQQRL